MGAALVGRESEAARSVLSPHGLMDHSSLRGWSGRRAEHADHSELFADIDDTDAECAPTTPIFVAYLDGVDIAALESNDDLAQVA
ncbi:hypothetical protein [Streptomyces albidoflavus]|uniref:hypothetical protein n=1 Tax=Streptomyces albidoflavus TaxID=1886 RepID=UPI0010202825|nr:hypothetical protein [Streptomyces albidoflavus]